MRNFVAYLAVFMMLVSCEELEEAALTDDITSSVDLQGTWQLESATNCFCIFADDFDFAANTLTFNEAIDEVIIENSENSFLIAKEGTYLITVSGSSIAISEKEYTFEIDGTSLTLNFVDDPEVEDDEITLNFVQQ